MALTNQQDIPTKPIAKEPWTFRRMFPFVGVTSALAKTFTSPFEIFFGFAILITGISELMGKRLSWMWYVTLILLLSVIVYVYYGKHFNTDKPNKPK